MNVDWNMENLVWSLDSWVREEVQEARNEENMLELAQASDDLHDAMVQRCQTVVDTIKHQAEHQTKSIPYSIHSFRYFDKIPEPGSTQGVADFDFEIVLGIRFNVDSCDGFFSELLFEFRDILYKNSEQLGIEPSSVELNTSMSEEHIICFRFIAEGFSVGLYLASA